MRSPSGSPLLALAGRSLAELRRLARATRLGSIYSRLNRTQLIAVLEQILPPTTPAEPDLSQPPQPYAGPEPQPQPQPEVLTQVTLQPADPLWAAVSWTLNSSDQQRAFGEGVQQLCLRLADVTGVQLGALQPHAVQEVLVDSSSRRWLLPVPLGGRDYRVELGYRLPAGGWLALASSAVVRMPGMESADQESSPCVPFDLDGSTSAARVGTEDLRTSGVVHERLYRQAVSIHPKRTGMGSELYQEHGESEDLASQSLHSDSGAGPWASGRQDSGTGLRQPRSFWLVADAELIVYGATEPSAQLFIGDERIALSSEGTFRVHVPFRDGQQLYPIRAVAVDGDQQRSIQLDFQRQTPEARVNNKDQATVEWF